MKKVLQITHKLNPLDDVEMALRLSLNAQGCLSAHAISSSFSDQEKPDTIIALFECEDLSDIKTGMRIAHITNQQFDYLKAKQVISYDI